MIAKLRHIEPPIVKLECDGRDILPGDEYETERAFLVWTGPYPFPEVIVTHEVKVSTS